MPLLGLRQAQFFMSKEPKWLFFACNLLSSDENAILRSEQASRVWNKIVNLIFALNIFSQIGNF